MGLSMGLSIGLSEKTQVWAIRVLTIPKSALIRGQRARAYRLGAEK